MSELSNDAPMTQADVMAGLIDELLKSPEQRRRERTLRNYQRMEQEAREEVFSNSQGTVGPWLAEHRRMEEGK